jgi:hypothetical protein
MRYLSWSLCIVAALMLPVSAAHSATMTFIAGLSGANERPDPVASPGTGLAVVVLDQSPQPRTDTAHRATSFVRVSATEVVSTELNPSLPRRLCEVSNPAMCGFNEQT